MEGGKTEKSRVPGAASRALDPRGGGNNVKLGANVDRCALPTSWPDCFKSDNKNETISRRSFRPTCTTKGNERHAVGRGVSNEQVTSSFNFCPAYAFIFPIPPPWIPLERGVTPHRG